MFADPMAIARAQLELWTEHALLWTTMAQKMAGLTEDTTEKSVSTAASSIGMERIAVFDYIEQSYLITAESISHRARCRRP